MSDYTEMHLARVALVTIDVQNDFTLSGAPGEIAGTREAVSAMRRITDAFRAAGRPIVHVVRLYRPDASNVDLARRQAVAGGATMVAPGTTGVELVDELKPDADVRLDADRLLSGQLQPIGPAEWVMYKPRWGAFYRTPLHEHLRAHHVDSLVVCGCNFPNCPRATVYEASERDYRIALLTDATSGLYQRGLDEVERIGVHLLDTDTLLTDLAAQPRSQARTRA